MKTIILLISLATVLTGIVVAQDDGKAIQNLRSILENADQQSPEDDNDALAQDLDENKQLNVLKSLLATVQDDEDFDLNSLLANAQDDDDDDLESLLVASQDDKNLLMGLLADKKDKAMVTTQDKDEDDLAQNQEEIVSQLSANEQHQDLKSSEQDEGQTQRYRRRSLLCYPKRCYIRYYMRYYNRYYRRYYRRYYKNRYIRYYSRLYSKYWQRYYNKHYSKYWKEYYDKYYSKLYTKKCKPNYRKHG